MSQIITKIKNSTPTHTGEEAQSMLKSVFTSSRFVAFPATIYGMNDVEEIADIFINLYAEAVTLSKEVIKIYNPIYIASDCIPENPSLIFYLLYYHNGHIVYLEDTQNPDQADELIVFIDKDVVKSFNLPYETVSASSVMKLVEAAEEKLTKDYFSS